MTRFYCFKRVASTSVSPQGLRQHRWVFLPKKCFEFEGKKKWRKIHKSKLKTSKKRVTLSFSNRHTFKNWKLQNFSNEHWMPILRKYIKIIDCLLLCIRKIESDKRNERFLSFFFEQLRISNARVCMKNQRTVLAKIEKNLNSLCAKKYEETMRTIHYYYKSKKEEKWWMKQMKNI